MQVSGGDTNVTTYFAMRLAADGTAATGLTITNFDLQYTRSGVAPTAKVDATALAATDSAHADNKAIEIDSTDQPGLYRVDWPDAAFAAGVREVVLTVKCATCFTEHLRVQIDPPVNVTQFGGTDGTFASGVPEVNTVQIGGTAQTANDVGADVDLILADTAELQGDWTNAGRLDAILDSILAMLDDARGEPGAGAPPVNPDAMTKLDYLYKAWRNKSTQTATTYTLYADDTTTADHTATVSDDGTTATKGEVGA